jgi:hypothetical protein
MSMIANTRPVRQREPRVRNKAYLGFIAQLPCIACMVEGITRFSVEVAHVKCGYPEDGWRAFGVQEKPHDERTVPLCTHHHRTGRNAQHGTDERSWWERLNVHPPALCAALAQAFPDRNSGIAVIRRFGGYP